MKGKLLETAKNAAHIATRAGANVFVAGSAVFNDPEGPAHAIATLTKLAEAAQ